MTSHQFYRLIAAMLCLTLITIAPCLAGDLEEGNYDYYNRDYDKAEDHFTAYLSSHSTSKVAYNNRGLARYHQGQFDEAIDDFDQATQINRSYVAPYINKGKALAAQKKFPEAVATYEDGLSYDSDNPKLLFGLGWVYDEQGEYDMAQIQFDKALAEDSGYERARLAKMVTLAKQGKTSDAATAAYDYINTATDNSLWRVIASYNLQMMRSNGLNFSKDSAAQYFESGIFKMGLGLYDLAINDFGISRMFEPEIADSSWLRAMAAALGGATEGESSSYLKTAQARMTPQEIAPDASFGNYTVFINGVEADSSSGTFYLFPGQNEVTIRSLEEGERFERTVPVYGTTLPGEAGSITLTLKQTSDYSPFSALLDTDRDWLGDDWELSLFGYLGQSTLDDSDRDTIDNLQEYWLSPNGAELKNPSGLLTQTQISQLYIAIFGRASEGEGNAYWRSEQDDMVQAANTMLATGACQEYFGDTLQDNLAFISFIYENTLGKTFEEDSNGIIYWASQLSYGKSKGEVVTALINAVLDSQYTGNTAQNRFMNKVAVSNFTADHISSCPNPNDLSDFVGFIDNITDDTTTVEAAKELIGIF